MSPVTQKRSKKALWITLAIIIIFGIVLAVCYFLFFREQDLFFTPDSEVSDYPELPYNQFTGESTADPSINNSPLYCIQMPNGSTDGARPQVGLNQAGVVFEAIAETGITRFAAIFQNPTSSAIGPIRSLRPYYLDWDTPFDCTVVHAGGSNEALSAINLGGQRNLDENYTYMWRENNTNRLWNNLFTSPTLLSQFNASKDYNTSHPQNFPRLTPDDASAIVTELQTCASDPECTPTEDLASTIYINFSTSAAHNVRYAYDQASNSYLRFHQNGDPHLTYICPPDLEKPNTKTACGSPIQIAPKAIVVMMVQENTMADNYHENIATIGTGKAYIFQNGTVTEATWAKTAQDSQITFTDLAGEVISFTPGQLWIAAVPHFGNVRFE